MFPTLEECESAVNDMKTNKSPGNDGIQANFTKHSGKIYILFFMMLLETFMMRMRWTTPKKWQ